MMLRTGSRQNKAFTLVEMLLVMVILGVIAGMAVPYYSASYGLTAVRQAAGDAANLVRYAQSQAILHGLTYQMVLDQGAGTYQVLRALPPAAGNAEVFEPVSDKMGRVFHVPRDVTFAAEKLSLRIFPDGSFEKDRITFSNGKKSFILSTHEQRGVPLVYPVEDQ